MLPLHARLKAEASIRNRPGQAARLARRRGDREQEVVELSSKLPVREERNNKQESLEVEI